MKGFAIAITFLLFMIAVGVHIVQEIYADYEYTQRISSYWSLSDKASTLEQKSAYLDDFVNTIKSAELGGNNAVFFATPDNSYEQNMIALTSLQTRMHEIQHMDIQSFQYQQAISQITAQEQGEADSMLNVFEGLWYKKHHFYLWDWVDATRWFLEILILIVSASFTAVTWDD